MPVRVNCPHCRTPCVVAEQHLGVPLQCGRCGRSFTTAPAATQVRLDIGAATSLASRQPRAEDCFLVQQLSWCNLDERHELALLVLARDGMQIHKVGTALTPLLNNVVTGSGKDIVSLPASIVSACRKHGTAEVVVIHDGEIHLGNSAAWRIYHQRAGRLSQITQQVRLAPGDWLVVVPQGMDVPALQALIGTSACSAVQLAEQLVEHFKRTVTFVVRCY